MTLIKRSILFKAEMIRAILSGLKGETRRLVKFDPRAAVGPSTLTDLDRQRQLHTWMKVARQDGDGNWIFWSGPVSAEFTEKAYPAGSGEGLKCPYGKPGDLIWVKENWRTLKEYDRLRPSELPSGAPVWYEAEGAGLPPIAGKLRPGLFMPRWASRLTLEVTEVKPERLQAIDNEGAINEGILNECVIDGEPMSAVWWNYLDKCWDGGLTPVTCYRTLWDSINADWPWEINCWVWVVRFRIYDGLPTRQNL